MKRITVNASRPYDVLTGCGLSDSCGKYISEVHAPCKALIVSDFSVFSLFGKGVINSVENEGFAPYVFSFAPGEKSKSPDTLVKIWNTLAENGFTRSDIIIALGGGISGDLAGFAAATYMRGIEYIQIPTTLLAMVDSSVGGKTAVNLQSGKNLAGSFHAPSLVICSTDALDTLPAEIYADGMAEVIKYRFVCPDAFDGCDGNDIDDVIFRCIDIKRRITENDEFDNGERRLLNFGHTAAHAIEKLSDNEISHGKAVAIGMAMIADACRKNGICNDSAVNRLTEMLTNAALPRECPYSAEEIAHAALSDKKITGNVLSLVVLVGDGKCKIHEIPADKLADFLKGKM